MTPTINIANANAKLALHKAFNAIDGMLRTAVASYKEFYITRQMAPQESPVYNHIDTSRGERVRGVQWVMNSEKAATGLSELFEALFKYTPEKIAGSEAPGQYRLRVDEKSALAFAELSQKYQRGLQMVKTVNAALEEKQFAGRLGLSLPRRGKVFGLAEYEREADAQSMQKMLGKIGLQSRCIHKNPHNLYSFKRQEDDEPGSAPEPGANVNNGKHYMLLVPFGKLRKFANLHTPPAEPASVIAFRKTGSSGEHQR